MGISWRVMAIVLATIVVLPLVTVTPTPIPVSSWVLDRNFYRAPVSDARV